MTRPCRASPGSSANANQHSQAAIRKSYEMEVDDRFGQVFPETLNDHSLVLNDWMTAAGIPGWDSVAHQPDVRH
jgi:hypothetical protein